MTVKISHLPISYVREILRTQRNAEVRQTLGIGTSTVTLLRRTTGIKTPAWKRMPDLSSPDVCGILHTKGTPEAARLFGISQTSVNRLRTQTGIRSPLRGRPAQTRCHAVLAILKEGPRSSSAMAASFGITVSGLLKCLRRMEARGDVVRTGHTRSTRWQLAGQKQRRCAA